MSKLTEKMELALKLADHVNRVGTEQAHSELLPFFPEILAGALPTIERGGIPALAAMTGLSEAEVIDRLQKWVDTLA